MDHTDFCWYAGPKRFKTFTDFYGKVSVPKLSTKIAVERLVIDASDQLAQNVMARLRSLMGEPPERYETLAKATSGNTDARILVAVESPVEAVATRLAEGAAPDDAIAGWKNGAVKLLSAARRVRRQLILVDARALLSNDAEILSQLGLEAADTPPAEEIPEMPDAMTLVLADALLRRNAEASATVAEIGALRHGAGGELDGKQIEAACEDLRLTDAIISKGRADHFSLDLARQNAGRQEDAESQAVMPDQGIGTRTARLSEMRAELARLQEENALLRENVGQHMSGHDEDAARLSDLETECRSLRQGMADRHILKAKADALQRRIETARERHSLRESLLSSALLADQRELSGATGRIDQMNRQVKQMADEVTHLRADLERVYTSRSWRLTRPLRSMRSRATSGQGA